MSNDAVERALQARQANEDLLTGKPNVIGTDIGLKHTAGEYSDEIAVRVFVDRKEDVAPDDSIPSTIDGVPTDVILVGEIVLENEDPADPLSGGISVGPDKRRRSAGTLGAIVLGRDGVPYGLTNYHVLAGPPDDWDPVKPGEVVLQPGGADTGFFSSYSTVGAVAKAALGPYVDEQGNASPESLDAAIFTVRGRSVTNRIKEIGSVRGSVAPSEKTRVRKYGLVTGLTEGTIRSQSGKLPYKYPDRTVTFTNVYFVQSDRPDSRFSERGDSGAIVVDAQNRAVGLHVGSIPLNGVIHSFGCSIDAVERALGVTVYTTLPAGPYFLTYNAQSGAVALQNLHSGPDRMSALWQRSWQPGWTIIEPIPTVLPSPHVFGHRQSDDRAVFIEQVDVDSDTARLGTHELWRSDWKAGWTHVVPFNYMGRGGLLEYKSGDGTVAMDLISDDYRSSEEVWRGTWEKDWTAVATIWQRSFPMCLLTYNAGNGTLCIHSNGLGSGTTELARYASRTGCTSLVTFVANMSSKPGKYDQHSFLLDYNRSTGDVALSQFDEWLTSFETMMSARWEPGWDTVQMVESTDASTVLLYNASSGAVRTRRFDRSYRTAADVWTGNIGAGWTTVRKVFEQP